MKKLILIVLGAFGALNAEAKLNVVATITDFGAIAQEIGGDKVQVMSIAKGTEDSHFVDARPSFVRVLNRADVLIEGGAELEVGWLPPLVNGARNAKILGDAPGHVVLGKFVQLIEVPNGPVDRSMGDVHPFGNPHFWLSPDNGKVIAGVVAATFIKLDPANVAVYQLNLEKFVRRLQMKMDEWSKMMAPFQGTRVISYHKSFDYFFERFGLSLAGTIESKPGVEPSPTYINTLVQRVKGSAVKLIIIEPYRPRRTPDSVAEAIGAKVLVLPEKVEGNQQVRDYIGLFDYDVAQIVAMLKAAQ